MIERVRIAEIIERMEKRLGRHVTRTEVAEAVFPDGELGRPQNGKPAAPVSLARKRAVISEWDRGRQLTSLKPRHLKRLAALAGSPLIHDLVEVSE